MSTEVNACPAPPCSLPLTQNTQERVKLSLDLKQEGNKAYSGKEYPEAIVFYSKAIQCDEQAVFYSNRAACTS